MYNSDRIFGYIYIFVFGLFVFFLFCNSAASSKQLLDCQLAKKRQQIDGSGMHAFQLISHVMTSTPTNRQILISEIAVQKNK